MSLWVQGDLVTRTVALLLLGMSMASWMVLLVKVLGLRKASRQAQACAVFWQGRDASDGLKKLGQDTGNPFWQLAAKGLEADAHLHKHEGLPRHKHVVDPNEWITRSLRGAIDDITLQMQSGLAVLASVGSTAPFVGLFGTVWGIYHALIAIGASGQSTIDKVAGPIGEALIMTALGLAVAIPAVLGYNALVRGNKGVLARLNRFAYELHAFLLTGSRIGETRATGG